ncbi:hypothetical protein ACRAWC_23660 [Leifsonia sp. L25]|uniref:hypothetical protein n=1 Tax=Leifsonia TaxID=110932 RepID=UPI003D667F03
MSNAKSRRIRLRQWAVLEPYASAQRYISGISSRSPIVDRASESQIRLEGEIFSRMGYIHEPRNLTSAHDFFVINRIVPLPNSLIVQLDPSSDTSKLNFSLLPTWERGSDAMENGVRGLRHIVDHRQGAVHFHVPGEHARVTFQGIDTRAFINAREEWIRSGFGQTVDSDSGLTPEEMNTGWGDRKAGPVASAFIRRSGLLQLLEPKWIDCWSSLHRFSVEVSIRDDAFDNVEMIIDQITSRAFSPRLERLPVQPTSSYYHPLLLEGTDLELDLRITTL